MDQLGKALDYMARLVQAAEAVDDVNLDKEVLNAGFLSTLLNLGGVYATLNLDKFLTNQTFGFLDHAWSLDDHTWKGEEGLKQAASRIASFLSPVIQTKVVLENARWRLLNLRATNDSQLLAVIRSPREINEIVEASRDNQEYVAALDLKDLINKGLEALQGASRSPSGKSNPLAIIDVEKFIKLIEEVEKVYTSDTPQEIITRVRNLYYSSGRFGFKLLIPDAPYDEVIPGTSQTALHTVRQARGDIRDSLSPLKGVSADVFKYLNAQADENALIDPMYPKGDNPSPYIRLNNGDHIDAGHLLLTLDALLHPRTGEPYTYFGVENIDAASWIADISIADVWLTTHKTSGKPNKQAPQNIRLSEQSKKEELDLYFRASASTSDLLGNIDGYGLKSFIRSGQSLSRALTILRTVLGSYTPIF